MTKTSRRAYTVIRSLVLGVSTMAIVGVLFAVYQYSTGVIPPPDLTDDAPKPPVLPQPGSDEQKTVTVGGARVGAGQRVTIRMYEPQGNQVRMELEVSAWEPTGTASDEFKLVDPRILLRTPEGQRVRITADEGWVNLVRGNGNTFEPRWGRLVGDVQIDIDRLSERERLELPQDEQDEPDQSRLIQIRFDEISFDLVQARLETKGPFRLTMAEAEVQGTGLLMRYNEVDSRIEHFEIAGDGRAVVWGVRKIFDVSLPGTGERVSASPESSAEPEAAETPVASVFAGRDSLDDQTGLGADASDDIPMFVPDQPRRPRVRPVQPYIVEIRDAITIQQFEGDQPTWQLAGDTLRVLFDFGPAQRNAARRGQSPLPAPDGGEETTSTVPDAAADPTDRVVFNWSGPLLLRPSYDDQPAEGDAVGKRLRLVVAGETVEFTGPQGQVHCRKLEVHRDVDRVWAFGAPEDPVVVTSPQCTELVATELFVDRRKGIAKITGPARLSEYSDLRQDAGAADEERRATIGDVEVRFDEVADFTLDTYLRQRIDPVTDEVRNVETEYISSARFVGAVKMRQGDDLIAGDRIEMTFDPPSTAGAFAQHIRTLEAQGGVVMIRGQDRVTCDDLSVRFGLGPDERTRPQIADAVGDVVVTQGTRTITARDRVTIEMIPILKAKAPFDLAAARLEALRRGLDPATVDWDDVRAEYEEKIEYTVGLQRIHAEGDVTAYDPVEDLDLRADSLLCTFRDGRNIDTARVVGFEDEPAYVQMGDFSITAGQVDVDGLQQRADVHGPGRLTFSTYQGLDGSRVATPQHVTISWTKEMTFRGADNIALFYGQVHVVSTREIRPDSSASWSVLDSSASRSVLGPVLWPTLLSALRLTKPPVTHEQSTFDCDELVIDFVDAPPSRPDVHRDQGALAQSPDDQWWIFAPLAKRFHIASPLVRDEPSRPNIFGSPRRKDRLSFNKEPVHLVASRNVVAVFSNTNPQTGRLKNRVRLDGDKMSVDLAGQVLSIPVPGTLLIEDYPLATIPSASRPGAPGAARSQPAPFGFAPSHLPAQTYIAWGDSMSFDFGQLRAEFIDDVFLDRRTGSKMKLAGALLSAQKLDPATMSAGGRRTQLRCNRLVAEFADGSGMGAGAPSSLRVGDERSAARLSANDIRQFDASGGVYLTDDDLVVHADRIAKFAQSRLLTIFGSEDADAEIYSQTNAIPWFQGPKFTYNFDTGEVQARNLRVRGP